MAASLRVKAYAKINLFLEITDRRSDGYHNLSTVFQTVSLADELQFKIAPDLSLSCSNPELPTDGRNLVLRAATLLKNRLSETKGAAIQLAKNVPTGAGLGGGSSDAAVVLTSLARLWRRQPSGFLLQKYAAQLGADVPFFLRGGTCAAGGIGDQLRPLPKLAKTWLVLVYPGFGVSTKEAYGRVQVPLKKKTLRLMLPQLKSKKPSDWAPFLFNRFEEFVFPDHPELPALKRQLVEAGAIAALMSGSGSSVFGIVDSEARGRKVLSTIKIKYPQSWLVHTL
jgi:4-diphosphocytidyl-2-C-methyl-D-erythritol kinase